MSVTRLILRNLFWHWDANVAVLLSVFVGSAVLTGALLVGNSLRGSLRSRALDQLGWVDYALVTNRFFTEMLTWELEANKVSPAIVLQSAASTAGPQPLHANKVTLLAVDSRFWQQLEMPVSDTFWGRWQPQRPHFVGDMPIDEVVMEKPPPPEEGVVLNRALAERLQANVGDKVALLLQSADDVPRETLVGKRKSDDVLSGLEVVVRAIIPNEGMGGFTLRPSAEPPLNAFVPLRLVQMRFDSDKKRAPLRGRINAIFAGGGRFDDLRKSLRDYITIYDWNLTLRWTADRASNLFWLLAAGELRPGPENKLRKYRWNGRIPEELANQASANGELTLVQFDDFFNKHHGYVGLESSQLFIESAVVSAAEKAASELGYTAAPTFSYMVDTLSDGENDAPYSIVAALDPQLLAPLGPIQPLNSARLKDDEILLVKWPGCPLKLEPGQSVTLSYDIPDAAGKLQRQQSKMRFAGWIDLKGAADDPDLTPRFEGITDRLSIRDWSDNLPFTVDKKRLKKADHDYWDRYRATPKAYVTLAAGQKMWGSRFGNVTSIRFPENQIGDGSALREKLCSELNPSDGGFVFQNVKEQALAAGQGSTDFRMLFLGFSFFLIIAAMLLVGLMFRLNLDRRASQLGLLLAVGWRPSSVRGLALAEGACLATLGSALGIVGAIGYAGLLLELLQRWWPGTLDHSFLRLHISWESCAIGFVISVLISLATIWWTTRVLAKIPPRALLAGETTNPIASPGRRRLAPIILLAALLGVVACLIAGSVAQGHEAQAGSFLGSGVFVLTALLAGLSWWMNHSGHGHGRRIPGLMQLGFRNASRHPVRSLLTVGLLGSASFLVIAVQAFHRDSGSDFQSKDGGSGGFAWIGESRLPIFQDLNSIAGRAELGIPTDLKVSFVPLRLQAGDDASCLNLYKAKQPRMLGVPNTLIERGGFQFAGSESQTANPWKLLLLPSDGVIPAIGEANTVKYMFNSGLGQEIKIQDGSGKEVRLHIVALLQDSVFQSELLVAEDQFLKLFPRQEGFQVFLIEAPTKEQGDNVRRTLETALANYGFSMTPSQDRLQSYLDVQNTYLATFQALGGLGLLLGTLGLAAVLVRSVWERRGELALLRALGFRRSSLGWLVFAENAWLLAIGLGFGCCAAGVAVAPFVVSQAGEMFQPSMLVLLGLVVFAGLAAGAIAMRSTLRTPLLPALRRE